VGDLLAADSWVLPEYDGSSLVAVMPAVARSLGVGTMPQQPFSPALAFPAAQRVLVVMCDGLGWLNLAERKAHARFLRSQLDQMQVLTSVFPATTAAAIPSFGTGAPPGQTGMVGYTVRNPANDALVNLVPWTQVSDPAVVATPVGNSQSPRFAIPPAEFQPEPRIFETLHQAGMKVTCVGGAKYAGSGLTQAAFGQPAYLVAEQPAARADAVVRLLRNRHGKQLVYLYWGELDKAGHRYGPDSTEWADALTDFDSEFARLLKQLPAGTLVVLTADHGQVTSDPTQQVDVAQNPELKVGVVLVAGEARAAHVYLHDAEDPALAAARWQNCLGDKAQVWTRSQAIEKGLFGPVRLPVRPWIGDLVVAAQGAATVVDSRTQTANSLTLPGVHGSATPTEMLIPLFVELI